MRLWISLCLILFLSVLCPAKLRGDLNGDCKVDMADLIILLSEWMQEEECMANNYLTFDGSTGYITVPDDAAITFGSGSFSICFWMKTNENEGGILQIYDSDSEIGMYAWKQTGKGCHFTFIDGSATEVTVDFDITYDQWFHVVCTFEKPGNATVYLNASPVDTKEVSGLESITAGASLYIGTGGYSGLYTGSLDDLRIYKGKALTAGEVATIYNNGAGKKYEAGDVTGATAVVAFDFDEGVGNPQSQGTVLTGTITGGVTWQDGGTPFETGGGGIFMDIFDELWAD